MTLEQIPIACTLTAEGRPERREMLDRLGRSIVGRQERPDGYAFCFASDDVLEELVAIVRAERQCCQFLRFGISCEPGGGPVWLEVTGPEGTKEFLGTFFGLVA